MATGSFRISARLVRSASLSPDRTFPSTGKKKAGRESGPAKNEGHNLQRGTSPGAMGGKHRAMPFIWGLSGVFSTNGIPKKTGNAKKSRLKRGKPSADGRCFFRKVGIVPPRHVGVRPQPAFQHIGPDNPLFRNVGTNVLKSRLRSHPDVARRHYADLPEKASAVG